MIKREDIDAGFMRVALAEAVKGQGKTWPNPMVGAVIVEEEQVVAKGFHRFVGGPHAEVEALQCLGRFPKAQATLYVTLEPCSTQGRTGPCTQAIIDAGIKEVVVGAIDLNPQHRGRGLEILRGAGIKVRSGILQTECEQLNLDFNHRMGQQQ